MFGPFLNLWHQSGLSGRLATLRTDHKIPTHFTFSKTSESGFQAVGFHAFHASSSSVHPAPRISAPAWYWLTCATILVHLHICAVSRGRQGLLCLQRWGVRGHLPKTAYKSAGRDEMVHARKCTLKHPSTAASAEVTPSPRCRACVCVSWSHQDAAMRGNKTWAGQQQQGSTGTPPLEHKVGPFAGSTDLLPLQALLSLLLEVPLSDESSLLSVLLLTAALAVSEPQALPGCDKHRANTS